MMTDRSNPGAAARLSAAKRELVRQLLGGTVSAAQTARLDTLGFSAPPPQLAHDAAGRYEPFPLTEMQQAYWVGRRRSLELGNVAIHSYLELDLPMLDVARLEQAWNRVIRAHDMLRAVIRPDGQQQVLRDVEPYIIAVETFSSVEAHDEARARLRARMSHELFQTERWPLFTVCVTRGPGGRSVVHLSVDGVLLDAWSLSTVIRQCLERYDAPEAPETVDAAPPITFRDYVLAERAMRERPSYRASLDWWRARLDALPPPPDLPLARHPRTLRAPTFVRRSGALEAEAWQRLKRVAGAEGLTPPCLVLTLYAQVLAGWTSTPAFTLNIPRFDRLPLHPAIDDVVGEFASFTLLSCDLSGRVRFADRVRRMQQEMWDVLEHGSVGGLTIVRELLRRRGRGGASHPVVFTANPSLGAHKPPEARTSLRGEVAHAITQTPQVWLDFQVGEREGGLAFNWDAVDALFPPGVLDEMHTTFCRRLDALARPDVDLRDVWD